MDKAKQILTNTCKRLAMRCITATGQSLEGGRAQTAQGSPAARAWFGVR